jgi:hypothetical protein
MTARVPGRRGRPPILVGLPVNRDDEDDHTKNPLGLRNATWIDGQCPNCGATPATATHPELGIVTATFWHHRDCPVADLLDPRDPGRATTQ